MGGRNKLKNHNFGWDPKEGRVQMLYYKRSDHATHQYPRNRVSIWQ